MTEENNVPIDFLIITALEEERDAILAKLDDYQKLSPTDDDVRVYFQSEVTTRFPDGSAGTYRVVVMPLLGMGRVEAAVATGDAIRRWNPRFILWDFRRDVLVSEMEG